MAIQPEPENRSRKDNPPISPRMENMDSLIRSMAGRIMPFGHFTVLLRYLPPVILILSNSVNL
jgi:hypothetical protein